MRWRRYQLMGMGSVVLGATWFLGVDRSAYEGYCPDCGFQARVTRYRLFALAIKENTAEFHTAKEQVARDLGAPCPHREYGFVHVERLWGLIHCAAPCDGSLRRLSVGGLEWYSDDIRRAAQNVAAEDPTAGAQFLQRAIFEHDRIFWHEFANALERAAQERTESDSGT